MSAAPSVPAAFGPSVPEPSSRELRARVGSERGYGSTLTAHLRTTMPYTHLAREHLRSLVEQEPKREELRDLA